MWWLNDRNSDLCDSNERPGTSDLTSRENLKTVSEVRAKLASGEKLSFSERSLVKRAERYLGNGSDLGLAEISQVGQQILGAMKDTGAQGYNFMGQSDLPADKQQGPGAALAESPGKLIYLRETVTDPTALSFSGLDRKEATRAVVHESAHNITGNTDVVVGGARVYGRQQAIDFATQEARAIGNPENLSFFFVP